MGSFPAFRAAAACPPCWPTPSAEPRRPGAGSLGTSSPRPWSPSPSAGPAILSGLHYLVARHLETGEDPPEYARPIWKGYLAWLEEVPPAQRHQRLHGSHYSFLDPVEARFITSALVEAVCLAGSPEEIVERVRALTQEGLKQIMLYPPLNRQYRVIEDFADSVMARL